MEFASKMVGVYVQLSTEWEVGVWYSFVLVAFDMGDLGSGEEEQSIGD